MYISDAMEYIKEKVDECTKVFASDDEK